MNRRERVKRAFHFNKPDRVPLLELGFESDFYPIEAHIPVSWQPTNYPPHVDGGAQTIKLDTFRRNIYDWKKEIREKLKYPENWWENPHDSIDEFGVIWRSSGTLSEDKTMGHPLRGPFQDNGSGKGWDKLDDFEFPNPSDPQRYRLVKSARWKTIAEDRYLLGSLGNGGLFNKCFQMRGFNNFLIDLARNRNQNKINRLIDSILSFNLIMAQKLKEYCPPLDSIMIADDFGTQKSAFISPRIFNKYFKNPFKQLVNLTHDLGMDFIFHSCGNVLALLPELVDIGVDVMEFDSPHMTGVESFNHFAKERKMAFWLSSNIQSTFVKGTPEEVEEEIRYYIKEVGNNEGGLAIYEYIDYDAIRVPRKNVRAQRKATLKWGNYNKDGIIEWLV
jgi:uroporphyrinogen decarboxylase